MSTCARVLQEQRCDYTGGRSGVRGQAHVRNHLYNHPIRMWCVIYDPLENSYRTYDSRMEHFDLGHLQ